MGKVYSTRTSSLKEGVSPKRKVLAFANQAAHNKLSSNQVSKNLAFKILKVKDDILPHVAKRTVKAQLYQDVVDMHKRQIERNMMYAEARDREKIKQFKKDGYMFCGVLHKSPNS